MNLRNEIELVTPALRRFAQALSSETEEVASGCGDDIVHEALLRALKFERPPRGLSVRLWLYSLICAIYRQESAESQAVANRIKLHRPHGLREANGGLWPEPLMAVTSALQKLDIETRECLLLVVLEGLTYNEVVDVLQIPMDVMLARLGRARAALSGQMKVASGPMMAHGQRQAPTAHLRLVK
ncbi:MAG: hypothetical protein KGQ37_00190 [Hyphomicrobiales bacterium]|nr:hypothetical protein [Hyphomicrobiales bacterium]